MLTNHIPKLIRSVLLFFSPVCLLSTAAGKPPAPKTVTVSTGNYRKWDFAPSAVFGTGKVTDTHNRYFYKITKVNDTIVRVERFNPAGIMLNKTLLYFLEGYISHLKEFNQWGEEYVQAYFTKDRDDAYWVTRRVRGENSYQPCKKAKFIFKGNLLKETRYFDDSGTICACSTGAAIIRYNRYDDANRYALLKSTAYYNEADSPTISATADCFKIVNEVDSNGNERSEKYIGPNGLPIANRIGIYGLNYLPPVLYNRYDVECTGAQGQIINNLLGFATVESVYSVEGFEVTETRFDNKYHITKTSPAGDGAAVIHYKHDGRGNETERTYHDEKDKPMNNSHGIYKLVSVFSDSNMLRELSYFDSAGAPFSDASAVHHYKFRRDSVGRLIAQQYFNRNDAPCEDNLDRVYEKRYRYDNYGRHISESYWNIDGEPMNRWNGYHETRTAYNDDGKPIEFAYLDNNGQFVKTNTGYSVQKIAYNRHGLVATRSYFDGDAPVMLYGRGAVKNLHAIRYTYDAGHRVTALDYLDNDNKPINALVDLGTEYACNRVEFFYEGSRVVTEKLYSISGAEPVAVIDCFTQRSLSTVGNATIMPNR